ncbi:MAG: O-antigen ligase family protein [Aquamicrobium sp.]|uniref:O-antigen ligase family protein n=1 Tax=Aquamicrobium sp. TaxID=1872579 RepID=UPI00349E5467|nr:O-antigen ligase family protein [Aquamicrobium sp.]
MFLAHLSGLPRLQNVSPRAVLACALLFVAGMALLGSLKIAGAFYVLSLLLGLYLLWRLPRVRIVMPPAVRLYLGFYFCFVALVLAHIAVLSVPTSSIDQVSRIGLGLLNGFIFLVLFGFSRERLFDFAVLVAAAHAGVAIAVALYQGLDFSTFGLADDRASGVTNAIPFSEMLMTSVGLVAIALAARIEAHRSLPALMLLALVVGLGLFAVFLTGTRGTLLGFLLLFPLMMVALAGRIAPWPATAFAVLALAAMLLAGNVLFQRDPGMVTMLSDFIGGAGLDAYRTDSVGIRLQMWVVALEMIRDAPLLGQGIDSYSEVLRRPELGVPADSVLFQYSNVHNQYLDMAMKTGLVGAVLFFAPLVIALVTGLRLGLDPERRVWGLAILWVGGSYAIYGLTQTFYGHASTTLQYGVYLGLLMWLAPGGSYGNILREPEAKA